MFRFFVKISQFFVRKLDTCHIAQKGHYGLVMVLTVQATECHTASWPEGWMQGFFWSLASYTQP